MDSFTHAWRAKLLLVCHEIDFPALGYESRSVKNNCQSEIYSEERISLEKSCKNDSLYLKNTAQNRTTTILKSFERNAKILDVFFITYHVFPCFWILLFIDYFSDPFTKRDVIVI